MAKVRLEGYINIDAKSGPACDLVYDIITPTYNRPNLLRKAISSVLKQTSSSWELWIYDDGKETGGGNGFLHFKFQSAN